MLNWRKSRLYWRRKPITTDGIARFEFFPRKLAGLSIFRIPETPSEIFVTDEFVSRVREHNLGGMLFVKVWPLPKDVNWGIELKRMRDKQKAVGLRPGKMVKGNAVVLRLALADSKSTGTAAEKRAVKRLKDQADRLLIDVNSDAPAIGSLEGEAFDTPGECRLFFSCPNADALVAKMEPWLRELEWPGDFEIVKRYGSYYGSAGREAHVRVKRRGDDRVGNAKLRAARRIIPPWWD